MSGEQNKQRQGRKRPKSYYKKCANQKRQKRNALEVGMKGFIVTCNYNEKQATMECYNILNEYADILYGPEQFQSGKEGATDDNLDSSVNEDEESEEEDIEKALDKEVKALKETKPSDRRFQSVTSGAKNCVFIQTSLNNPSDLAHYILNDFAEKKVQKARYAARLLPIQVTCKANVDDIMKTAEELFGPYFRTPFGTSHTFSVLIKARNNGTIKRDTVVPKLGHLIKEMNPLNSCHYDRPDYLVLVEILCSVCCLGVVKDFYRLRKYNLHEVTIYTKDPEAAPRSQEDKSTTQTSTSEISTAEAGATRLVDQNEFTACEELGEINTASSDVGGIGTGCGDVSGIDKGSDDIKTELQNLEEIDKKGTIEGKTEVSLEEKADHTNSILRIESVECKETAD